MLGISNSFTVQWGVCSWTGSEYWHTYPVAFSVLGYVFAWDGGVGRALYNAWGADPVIFRILSDNGTWSASFIAIGY